MEAKVNEIYFSVGGEHKINLLPEKNEVEPIDNYEFKLMRKFLSELEMSRDPSDGNFYTLLIGFFVDGEEVKYVTDWFPNDQEKRTGLYPFDIPKYAKYSDPKKLHRVQIKLGQRKTAQWMRKREYDLYESPVFFYKVEPSHGD